MNVPWSCGTRPQGRSNAPGRLSYVADRCQAVRLSDRIRGWGVPPRQRLGALPPRHNTNLDSATKTYYQCGMPELPKRLEKLRTSLPTSATTPVALEDDRTLSGRMVDLGDVEVFMSAMSSRISLGHGARIGSPRATLPPVRVEEDSPHWLDDVTIGMKYADLAVSRATHRLRCVGWPPRGRSRVNL